MTAPLYEQTPAAVVELSFVMSSRIRWLVVAVACAGLGLSAAALFVHYWLLTDPSYVSPCDISATFSCSAAYLSRYGSIHGVPTAVGGVLWFGIVALVAGFAAPARDDSPAASYLFVLVLAAVPVVAFLGYASYAQLRSGCPICMGVYGCVLAILALTAATRGVPFRELPTRAAGDLAAALRRPAAAVLALLLVAAVVAIAVRFPREGDAARRTAAAPPPSSDVQRAFAAAWAKQPRVDLGVPAGGAKVVVVKFNDYECTACRYAENYYRPIFEKFAAAQPGAVKIVFKDWVWNTGCNANVSATIPGHEASCVAAVSARMAQDRGKGADMAAWLFDHQGVTPAAVRDQATRMLGLQDFDREAAAKMTDVQRDLAQGAALRIDATPTYFINGVRIPSAHPLAAEYFELAITLELQRAAQP